MLVLRLDKDVQGRDLTGQLLKETLQKHVPDGTRFLNKNMWYKDEPFFISDTCTSEWKFVSAGLVLNSCNQDYASQTRILKDMAKQQGVLTPQEEQECSEEVLQELAHMATQLKTRQEAARRLSELEVNQRYRPTFIEALFDNALAFLVHKKRHLFKHYTWTSSRSSPGYFMIVGCFDEDGLFAVDREACNPYQKLGVSFSR